MLASPSTCSFSSTLPCLVSYFLGSLTDEHLDCFHPLAVSTNDAQTVGVQIFLRDPTCSSGGRYISRNRIAEACGNSPFMFEEILYLFFFYLLVCLLFALTRKTSALVHFMWYSISKSLTLAICVRSAVFVLSHFVT